MRLPLPDLAGAFRIPLLAQTPARLAAMTDRAAECFSKPAEALVSTGPTTVSLHRQEPPTRRSLTFALPVEDVVTVAADRHVAPPGWRRSRRSVHAPAGRTATPSLST